MSEDEISAESDIISEAKMLLIKQNERDLLIQSYYKIMLNFFSKIPGVNSVLLTSPLNMACLQFSSIICQSKGEGKVTLPLS